MPHSTRNLPIAAGVVLFHVAALWALQSGLVRRAAEVAVPVAILSEIVTPPKPQIAPPPPTPVPRRSPEPDRKPLPRKAGITPPPVQPAAVPHAVPTPRDAPAVPAAQSPPAPAAMPPAVEVAPPVAPPLPAKVELPSSNASYLQNPTPSYPPISKRLGEQGKVIVRVLIGRDGIPQQAELKNSSGFERLDRSALEYVMKCRYVPGKVGGVPQAMWYEAPVSFVLE